MKFLVDENLSPRLCDALDDLGHEAVHVRDIGLKSASDVDVLARARADGAVLLSADTDFGAVLAASGADRPSVIIVRRSTERRTADLVALLGANLPDLGDALEEGSIVVLDPDRIRIRKLPLP